MADKLNYMRVIGPHCCIRCDFKCDTSEEMTEHLNSKHPGWMTERLQPDMVAPKPEPNEADRERASIFFDGPICSHRKNRGAFSNDCQICFAAELAAVREENDADWIDILDEELNANLQRILSGKLGNKAALSKPYITSAILYMQDGIKQDLLSLGPCGKKGHRKVDWVVDVGVKGMFQSRPYREYCTACESEKERMEPLVEALKSAHLMLLKRDEMNAAVHCQELRLSPVTEKVGAALKAWENK